MKTYPFSVPSGVNIIPQTSGASNLGFSSAPFSGVYAVSINDLQLYKSAFMEQPAGNINSGTNAVFTLANTPLSNSLALFKNGLFMAPSGAFAGNFDYTLSGATITFTSPPISGSTILAYTYLYQ